MIRHLGPTDWAFDVTVSSLIVLVAGLMSSVLDIGVREYATLGHDERIRPDQDLWAEAALATLGIVAALAFALAAGYPPVLVAGIALWGIAMSLSWTGRGRSTAHSSATRLGEHTRLLRQGARCS